MADATTPPLDTRNVNALWAGVMARTLQRCGVRRAVISPGSRSTPLAFAFARETSIEAIPVLDERSAAFFALGLAKQDMRPVVLVCTSGTAGANYFPAVIEAHEAGVPLIVLTADRPPEMRACGSGQTIDQQGLYGRHVSFFHEVAVPAADLGLLRYLRQTTAHAVERALAPFAGPVHLNVPFRDPLPPLDDGGAVAAFAKAINWEQFFAHLAPPAPVIQSSEIPVLQPQVHGVIIAGPCLTAESASHAALVGALAKRLGWPVLADGLSPVRNHVQAVPHLVTRYDAILRTRAAAEALKPEFVLCVGEWPTSKVLRSWVESSGAPVAFVTERPDNRDALHGATVRVVASLNELVHRLSPVDAQNGYERLWHNYEVRARTWLESRLAAETAMVEPKVAWVLARALPKGTPISVANSMPIRDMEFVWPGNEQGHRIIFSRGANGIDGTLSTALGAAHGSVPSVLLTGDLAFLHDANGLLSTPRFRGSLTVVLINNKGGGIFEHLPVAQFEAVFEDYFATPQDVDIAKLCAAHGVSHMVVEDWTHLEKLVSVLPPSGIHVLEVHTDRKRDATWRKETFASVLTQG